MACAILGAGDPALAQTTLLRTGAAPIVEPVARPRSDRAMTARKIEPPPASAPASSPGASSERQMTEQLRALDREAADGRMSLEAYRERQRLILGAR